MTRIDERTIIYRLQEMRKRSQLHNTSVIRHHHVTAPHPASRHHRTKRQASTCYSKLQALFPANTTLAALVALIAIHLVPSRCIVI